MIVIVDNGEQYSGHAMCFVELGEGESAEERLRALEDVVIFTTYNTKAFIVATTESIEWQPTPKSGLLWLKPATWEWFVSEWNVHRPPCSYVIARRDWWSKRDRLTQEEARKTFPSRELCDCGILAVGK